MSEVATATIDKAIEAWGREDAQEILGEIAGSVLLANSIFQPPYPVDSLDIAIVKFPWEEKTPVIGRHTDWTSIGLVLDETQMAYYITPLIAPTVVHETAHLARHQHISNRVPRSPDYRPLEAAFTEGIALLTQDYLFPDDNVPGFWRDYIPSSRDPVDIELKSLLSRYPYAEPLDDDSLHEFIFGDDEFHHKGYKIGYCLAKQLLDAGFSIEELISLPTDEVYKYATTA